MVTNRAHSNGRLHDELRRRGAVARMRSPNFGNYQRCSCRPSPRRRFSTGCVPKAVGFASEHVS